MILSKYSRRRRCTAQSRPRCRSGRTNLCCWHVGNNFITDRQNFAISQHIGMLRGWDNINNVVQQRPIGTTVLTTWSVKWWMTQLMFVNMEQTTVLPLSRTIIQIRAIPREGYCSYITSPTPLGFQLRPFGPRRFDPTFWNVVAPISTIAASYWGVLTKGTQQFQDLVLLPVLPNLFVGAESPQRPCLRLCTCRITAYAAVNTESNQDNASSCSDINSRRCSCL